MPARALSLALLLLAPLEAAAAPKACINDCLESPGRRLQLGGAYNHRRWARHRQARRQWQLPSSAALPVSSETNSSALEPGLDGIRFLFHGDAHAGGGLGDFACPGRADSADLCACQVRCKGRRCGNALLLCRSLSECSALSFNGASPRSSQWATLKKARAASDWMSTRTARAILSSPAPPAAAAPREVSFWAAAPAAWTGTTDPLCGNSSRALAAAVRQKKLLGIFALTMASPRSLESSFRSWSKGGLLALASEKVLLANEGAEVELALARKYGFAVKQPKELGGAGGQGGGVRRVRENVITIGQAFGYAMRSMSSDFVLFLEKDFALHASVSSEALLAQLGGATTLLEGGVALVYLRSRTEQGNPPYPPLTPLLLAADSP